MALLPVDEALKRLLSGVAALESEQVPLAQAAGRILSASLAARRTQPPFDASAMDGYAVRAADVAVGARLTVVGEAPAGRGFRGEIGPGEALRIFTGAPVPKGADTILIQENARVDDAGGIEVTETVAPGRHIRHAGLDFEEGDILLETGRSLDPAALSLAASANHAVLEVVRRPLVAIFATGDELVPPGHAPGPDQIVASNAYGVAAIAERHGAGVLDLGIVPDRREAIADAILDALARKADIVVTLGGASVGDHDLVREVLGDNGMELDFWKIAMRPGKPLMFGRFGHVRVLGLPGNPVASLVCSHLFLAPLIARLGGRAHAADIREARLGRAMAANDRRQDYVRAKVEFGADGPVATPFPIQDSSMLRTLADAEGLIIRAPFAPESAAGAPCRVMMLR